METTTIKLRLPENQRAVECLQSRADSLLKLIHAKDCQQVPGLANYGALLLHDHLEMVREAIICCIRFDLVEGHVWNGQGTRGPCVPLKPTDSKEVF